MHLKKNFLTAVTAFGGHACTESTVPGDAGCTVGGVSETDAGVSAGNRGEEDEIRGSQEERRGECAHHCQTDEQDSETAGTSLLMSCRGYAAVQYIVVPLFWCALQDSIADLRRRMAANTKDSDEKTRAIKEVRQPTTHPMKDISVALSTKGPASRADKVQRAEDGDECLERGREEKPDNTHPPE